MGRKIILVLCLLLAAGQAWGANLNIFASVTGSGTDCTSVAPCTLQQAMTNAKAAPDGTGLGQGHNVYVGPGTYNQYILCDNDNQRGTTIQCVTADGGTVAAPNGCILSRTSGGPVEISKSNITINGISLTTVAGAVDGWYIHDCDSFIGNNIGAFDVARYSFRLTSATNFKLNNPTITGSPNGGLPIYVTLTSNGNIINPIMSESVTNQLVGGETSKVFLHAGSGDVFVFNGLIFGQEAAIASTTGTGGLYFVNTYLGPPLRFGVYQMARSSGVLSVDHSIWVPEVGSNHYFFNGTVGDTDNIKTNTMHFNHHKRSGFICPEIDDSENIDYAILVKNELASRGMKGTFYMYGLAMGNPAYKAKAQTLVAENVMTVGIHGGSGGTLLTLTGNIWAGDLADCTSINIDRTGTGTMTVVGTPGGTVTDFRTKLTSTIKTELTALGCTVGNQVAGLGTLATGEIIASSSGVQSIPYAPQILVGDSTEGLLYLETVYAKAYAESELTGYTGKAFGTPGGAFTAEANTAIAAAGFLGNRNIQGAGSEHVASQLKNFDIMNQHVIMISTGILGASDADTVRNTHALADWAASHGMIIHLVSHTAAEVSIAAWELILDALAQHPDVTVTSADNAYEIIRNGGLWTADVATPHRTYTRTWTDKSDYSLVSNSPAVESGVAAMTYAEAQAAGVTVYGAAPDIGAYEYRKMESTIVPRPIIFDAPQPPCVSTNAACYVQ